MYLVEMMTNVAELCYALNYDKELTIDSCIIMSSIFNNLIILNSGSVCAWVASTGYRTNCLFFCFK